MDMRSWAGCEVLFDGLVFGVLGMQPVADDLAPYLSLDSVSLVVADRGQPGYPAMCGGSRLDMLVPLAKPDMDFGCESGRPAI